MPYIPEELDCQSLLEKYPPAESTELSAQLAELLDRLGCSIVVLDDDPTGIQTVHGVPVYTDWETISLADGLASSPLFFVLTNSRSFSAGKTERVHRQIAENLLKAAGRTGKRFLLVSRGDSTLRGHYPLETRVLRDTLWEQGGMEADGELIIPFFPEGGRYTAEDVHYVRMEERLVPAGETEFAGDKTFGYHSSHLGEWVEEKTGGEYPAVDCTYITLEDLENESGEAVLEKLRKVRGFGKVIVNAVRYRDLQVFCKGLLLAMLEGRTFLSRTAAGFVRIIGNIAPRPLLTAAELTGRGKAVGLVIAGSHVGKTTGQLARLLELPGVQIVECDQHRVLEPDRWREEVRRVAAICNENLGTGVTTVVMTRRERLDLNTGNPEDELRVATQISDGLVDIVKSLEKTPDFLIAKGGITSSDIGVKGLGVRRAVVLGQVLPGVPVWQTGPESRFPGMPYIIFPGNVGGENDLRDTLEMLMR